MSRRPWIWPHPSGSRRCGLPPRRSRPTCWNLTALISAVASPTGEESGEVASRRRLFATEGLATERDAIGDVVGVIPGRPTSRPGCPAPCRRAHRHGVSDGTPLEVKRSADRLIWPGVGDNSVAVAAAISGRLLRMAGEVPAVDVLLTGNVGEEGLGNLRGIREVMASRRRSGRSSPWKATIWAV